MLTNIFLQLGEQGPGFELITSTGTSAKNHPLQIYEESTFTNA